MLTAYDVISGGTQMHSASLNKVMVFFIFSKILSKWSVRLNIQAALAAGVRRKILVTTGHGLKLVGEELDVWSLKPPCFVLPALGDFGGLPSEVLPVSIHADLKSAAEELLADSLAGTTVQEVDEET